MWGVGVCAGVWLWVSPTATTSSASMVDMRVLEELERRHAVLLSPELRAPMEKARTTADDMRNVNLTPAEQVWSVLHSLSTSGEAQRRLQNVPEGKGAEAWKAFLEHYEPKTTTRYVRMLRQILLYDFGELTQLIDRIEQFRHLVKEQIGLEVSETCAGNIARTIRV